MADSDTPLQGAPPRAVHIGPENKSNLLPWILLALGIAALLYYVLKPKHEIAVTSTTTTETPAPVAATETVPATGASVAVAQTASRSISTLGSFFTGTDATPSTFEFDTLKFDTDKSAIRDADRPTLDQVSSVLKQYGSAKGRIVGYADASGDAAHNAELGKARAEAVKAALVERGIAAEQLDTASGGADDPVASSGTSGGRAENRRTEFVITSR